MDSVVLSPSGLLRFRPFDQGILGNSVPRNDLNAAKLSDPNRIVHTASASIT